MASGELGGDAYARYYDLDSGAETEDVAFYVALARQTGGPVLEIGCGTGRVLVPLAEAGFDVVGLDVSPAMLARCRQRVAAAGVGSRVQLVEADARHFSLGEQYSLVVVALNSFMHFATPADAGRVLDSIRRHLRITGTLAIDLPNPEPALLGETGGLLVHEWTRQDPATGQTVLKLRSQRIDAVSQLLDLTFIYDAVASDGSVQRAIAALPLRYYHPAELRLLLESRGFVVDSFYGGYDLDDFGPDSPKLIVTAGRSKA